MNLWPSRKVTRYLQHRSSSACPFLGFLFLYGIRTPTEYKTFPLCCSLLESVFCRHCNEYSQALLNKCERSWKDTRHDGEPQRQLQSLGNNSDNCYLAEHQVFRWHFIIIFMFVSHTAQHSACLSNE